MINPPTSRFSDKHYLLINMMHVAWDGPALALSDDYLMLLKLYMKAIKRNKVSYWT